VISWAHRKIELGSQLVGLNSYSELPGNSQKNEHALLTRRFFRTKIHIPTYYQHSPHTHHDNRIAPYVQPTLGGGRLNFPPNIGTGSLVASAPGTRSRTNPPPCCLEAWDGAPVCGMLKCYARQRPIWIVAAALRARRNKQNDHR
jgi:hypothetical protein